MPNKSVHKLWSKGDHNAFTDLCHFQNNLYCCFREASNHVSPDGIIRVLQLNLQGKPIRYTTIRLHGADLRDPKLTVTPEGKMLLLAYGRFADEQNRTRHARPVCWVSQDGKSWSSPRWFADPHWWLWRLRWHQQQAYGFAYNRASNAIHFYAGNPLRTFEKRKQNALSLQHHGKGYPNESDLVFNGSGKAFALIRRDADTFSAMLGVANPPYVTWQWHDLKHYIGGPAMLLIDDNLAVVAGRVWFNQSFKTAILRLNLSTCKLTLIRTLPSAGDNSYPGLVINGETLWCSYYSSHSDHKSNIYLAKLSLQEIKQA